MSMTLLSSYLDDGGWHTEAENVRNGVDLESYENELSLIDWLLRHAHLTQPAQSCQHDWAEGYGVPAYCNHCGKTRDSLPAQPVDGMVLVPIEPTQAMLEAMAESYWGETWNAPGMGDDRLIDARNMYDEALTAALQEKGNG